MKKWIRIPGPGEMRGEGRWVAVSGERMEADFSQCKRTGYLPVAWQVEDHVQVTSEISSILSPALIVKDGILIHQLHEMAVPLLGVGPQAQDYALKQLKSIIESLTVEGANVA